METQTVSTAAAKAAHVQNRIIMAWFDANFQRTDGRFTKRNSSEYNRNCVVVNAETLWQLFRYHLHLSAAEWCPSKPYFFQVLRWYNVRLKPVKNRFVGSIKLAALACPLPKHASQRSMWYPAGHESVPRGYVEYGRNCDS